MITQRKSGRSVEQFEQAYALISGITLVLFIVILVMFTRQIKIYMDDLNKQRRLQIYMKELTSVVESMQELEQKEAQLTMDIEHFKELLTVDNPTNDDQKTALEKPLQDTATNL